MSGERGVLLDPSKLPLSEVLGSDSVAIRVQPTPVRRGSADEFARRFWERVDKRAGADACWPWTAGRLPSGYGTVWANGRANNAHRIAWTLTYGPIPPGRLVCHHCDNRICCNPAHLYVGTHWDNTNDMVVRGRHNRDGRRHLTRPQVVEIRERYAAGGVSLAALGAEYGVTDVCIYLVVARKTWRNVA